MQESISSSLNTAFDHAEWKTNMDNTVAKLQERISRLEEHNMRFLNGKTISQPGSKLELKKIPSNSFAEADYEGIGFFRTFTNVIRSNLHAKLQFLVMLVFVISFTWYVVSRFQVAKANEESDFKPESKSYVIDFTKEHETLQYKFPYIWFKLYVTIENTTVGELDTYELVDQLLQSQGYFQNRV